MYTDDQLDSALRTLDPADRHIDPLGPRAATDLDVILATGPADSAGGAQGKPRRRPRRSPVRRAALVGAAAAVLALGIVAVPTLTPDGDQGTISWAAVPQPLAAEQRPDAAQECRNSYRDGPGGYSAHLDSARVAVAEQRGTWVAVVLSGDDGFTATCIGDASVRPFAGGMVGSVGTLAGESTGPRVISPTLLGVATMDDEELSMLAGVAGPEVAGVTYTSEEHGDVVATVSDERFALWIPGDELREAHRGGAEVEVTYADGSTESVRLSY